MKNLYFIFLALIFTTSALAQNVSGTVSDENGEALIGANIQVKGTTTGTITDLEGKFSLVHDSDFPVTIEISYIGFTPQEIEIRQATSDLQVQLVEGVIIGQEIVETLPTPSI